MATTGASRASRAAGESAPGDSAGPPEWRPPAGPLLISLPNWLGDAVLATGLLASLRRENPRPVVDICGNATAVAVAALHPVVRSAYLFERAHRRPRALLALAGALRGQRYGAHVVLGGGLSAVLLARAVGAPVRAAFDGPGRSALVTHRLRRGRRGSLHLLDEYRRLLALAGVEAAAAEPEVPIQAAAAARAAVLLGGRQVVVVAAGATYGPTKRWPAERFARVAAALAARHGLAVALVGGAGDEPAAGAVRAALGDRVPLIDLVGRTDLPTLAAVVARARIVLANDSGPMHLARAAGAPAVGIFGSTDPRWTGPRGGRVVVAAEPPPCAPCYRRRCGIGFVCLTRIASEQVLEAAEEALAGAAR